MKADEYINANRQAQALADRINRKILVKNPGIAAKITKAAAENIPIPGHAFPAVIVKTQAGDRRIYIPHDMATAQDDRIINILKALANA